MLKSFKWLQNQAEEFNTCESENNNLLNTDSHDVIFIILFIHQGN